MSCKCRIERRVFCPVWWISIRINNCHDQRTRKCFLSAKQYTCKCLGGVGPRPIISSPFEQAVLTRDEFTISGRKDRNDDSNRSN
jgi:hypothetical protein